MAFMHVRSAGMPYTIKEHPNGFVTGLRGFNCSFPK